MRLNGKICRTELLERSKNSLEYFGVCGVVHAGHTCTCTCSRGVWCVVCGGGPEAEAMDKNDIHVLMG
jgi:hypothetical protein